MQDRISKINFTIDVARFVEDFFTVRVNDFKCEITTVFDEVNQKEGKNSFENVHFVKRKDHKNIKTGVQ